MDNQLAKLKDKRLIALFGLILLLGSGCFLREKGMPTPVPGPIETSTTLNDDQTWVAHSAGSCHANEMTVEVLVKFDSLSGGTDQYILSKWQDNEGFALRQRLVGGYEVIEFLVGSSAVVNLYWMQNLETGVWYYVVGTFSPQEMSICVGGPDGLACGTNWGEEDPNWGTHPLRIGAASDGLSGFLDGTIGGYVSIRGDIP